MVINMLNVTELPCTCQKEEKKEVDWNPVNTDASSWSFILSLASICNLSL